jgi:hypothetical protein
MIEALVTSIVILMAWSFLYRENIFYRIGEALLVGLALALSVKVGIDVLINRIYIPIVVKQQWLSPTLIAVALGLMMYTRFSKSLWWMSRWPIALLSGAGLGIAMKGAVMAQIVRQLDIGSLITRDVFTGVNNLILLVTAITSLAYFLYTFEHRGALAPIAKLGIYSMMICFGTTLGLFLMSNIGFAISLIPNVVKPPGLYVSIVAIILIIADNFLRKRKE